MKTCTKCGEEKELDEFYKRNDRPCGLQSHCKKCQSGYANRWNKTNRARTRKSLKHYRDRNRAYYNAVSRRWCTRNPAQVSLNSARQRARLQKVRFTLTRSWIDARIKKGCALTGLPFDYEYRSGKQRPFMPSIDRIHAGGPYMQRNCRVVMLCVNTALGSWGLKEFLPIAQALLDQNNG